MRASVFVGYPRIEAAAAILESLLDISRRARLLSGHLLDFEHAHWLSAVIPTNVAVIVLRMTVRSQVRFERPHDDDSARTVCLRDHALALEHRQLGFYPVTDSLMKPSRSFLAMGNGKQWRLGALGRGVFVDSDDKRTADRIRKRDDFRRELILGVFSELPAIHPGVNAAFLGWEAALELEF